MTRLFGLILIAAVSLPAQNYPAPPFVPPPGHPRVYFTAKDLPSIRANSQKPEHAAAWAAHLAYLKKGTDGSVPSTPDSRVLAAIESYAFDYALNGTAESGRKAISAMRNYLKTATYPAQDYNNAGQAIFTVGIVYDWCYPLLSSDDKEALYQGGIATAGHLEVGWPPVQQGDIVGHGAEGQIQRDLMSMAVAMYDEKPELYKTVAGRFFSGMVEYKKFVYQGHMNPQGNHYSIYRGQWDMLATWIFDKMGLPKVFGSEQQYFLYWHLYARRPDGQLFRDGDTHGNNLRLGSYDNEPARPMLLAANYFNDPFLKTEALREIPNLTPWTPKANQTLNPVEILVFNKPELAGRPVEELPLTHYFPSPKGAMIARTSWKEGLKSAAVVVEMKINEWFFTNHQHLDAGSFQIYYRGALATDSGYYQASVDKTDDAGNTGSTGYASIYDYNYNKRSIAHNTMMVYDPAERFEAKRAKKFKMANDGGQRLPNSFIEPKSISEFRDPANRYRTGEVLAHHSTPEYSYLKGDLAAAYSDKVKAYERSFVFLNLQQDAHPAAVVVFDRVVSSKPEFRKAFLLHGLEKPEIAGNQAVFKDTRPGYTGKLTLTALLPAENEITGVGGPGREAWVDGTNYLALTRATGNNEGGGWRVEVSPKVAQGTDYFLNVMQVGDHTPDAPALPVQKIETASHAGFRLAERVVLFAKSRDRLSAPVQFDVAGTGSVKILVADLQAGVWQIERAEKPAGKVTVGADGLAYFTGDAGSYRLRR